MLTECNVVDASAFLEGKCCSGDCHTRRKGFPKCQPVFKTCAAAWPCRLIEVLHYYQTLGRHPSKKFRTPETLLARRRPFFLNAFNTEEQ